MITPEVYGEILYMETGNDMKINFPLGNDSFTEIRQNKNYYIDKTDFIKNLLSESFKVSLITRPRRFGKSLTMSMLEDFFDINRDSREDFEGLSIMKEPELCAEWMNKWPVIFITFKSVEGLSFESAYGMLKVLISDICIKHNYLMHSDDITLEDLEVFKKLKSRKADDEDIKASLYILSRMMNAHYGKPVILLIDEYDVPLAKAGEVGYYDEMMDVIRAMLGKAFKTNEYLKFAVLTGCLKIAKESIFTGTNNFVSDTITSDRFDEYIGFTQGDVDKILKDAGFEEHAEEIKYWYDGYRFGSVDVYCPWDVLNHAAALQVNPETKPKNYWGSTSHNGVIYKFIDRRDLDVNEKFEALLAGECLIEEITEDMTYDTLKSSEENLWSLLYLTGYLTQGCLPESREGREPEEDEVALRIPNEEVKRIFRKAIVDWFNDAVKTIDRSELFDAMWNGDEKRSSELITEILFDTISYHDYKESYYHAFIAGLFTGAGYAVGSNYERGNGRPDVVVKDRANKRAILIEAKHVDSKEKLSAGCAEAVAQINDKKYATGLHKAYRRVVCYGIAFCEKDCMVKRAE